MKDLYERCMDNNVVRQFNEQRLQCSLPLSAYGSVEYQSTQVFWEGTIVTLSQIVFCLLLLFSATIIGRMLLQRRPIEDFEGIRRLEHSDSGNKNTSLIDQFYSTVPNEKN